MHTIYPISKPLSLLFLHSKMISRGPSYRLPCSCLNLEYPLLNLIFLLLNLIFHPFRILTEALRKQLLFVYFSRVHTCNLCVPIIPSSLYLLFQLNFLCQLLNILCYWYLIFLGFKSNFGIICIQVTCKIVELDGKLKVVETLVKFYDYLT